MNAHLPPYSQLPPNEQLALLTLTLLGNIPKEFLDSFVKKTGSFSQLFEGKILREKALPEKFRQKLSSAKPKENAPLLEQIERRAIRVIHRFSPEYPGRLNQLKNPPTALFLRGELNLQEQVDRSVAIVGTRKPDARGLELTREVAEYFAARGWLVISGGAAGIDAQAHLAALGQSGKTAAVLAGSITSLYPPENRELFEQIVGAGGALIAEYPPGKKLERGLFPRRNRIISALAQGVVVVQCGEKSGALNTAAWAEKLDRPICTFPGLPLHPLSAGPHHLIRKGAHLVETPEEIRKILLTPSQIPLWPVKKKSEGEGIKSRPNLSQPSRRQGEVQTDGKTKDDGATGWMVNSGPASLPGGKAKTDGATLNSAAVAENLPPAEREIVRAIIRAERPLSAEELSLKLKLPPHRLTPLLLQLELKEIISTTSQFKYRINPKISGE